MRISQRRRCRGWSLAKYQRRRASVFLSLWSQGQVIFPTSTRDNTHRVLPAQGADQSLGAEFLWRFSHVLPVWLTLRSQTSGGRTDNHMALGPQANKDAPVRHDIPKACRSPPIIKTANTSINFF